MILSPPAISTISKCIQPSSSRTSVWQIRNPEQREVRRHPQLAQPSSLLSLLLPDTAAGIAPAQPAPCCTNASGYFISVRALLWFSSVTHKTLLKKPAYSLEKFTANYCTEWILSLNSRAGKRPDLPASGAKLTAGSLQPSIPPSQDSKSSQQVTTGQLPSHVLFAGCYSCL